MNFNEVLTQIKDFCGEYGFYFAIAAVVLLVIWLITWIALGVKCRKLKKSNKALCAKNAEYAQANEKHETETARAAAQAKAETAETAERPAPAESASAAPAQPLRQETAYEPPAAEPAPEPDDDEEEFDITAAADESDEPDESAPEKPVKETSVNYVVKYDRTRLSWVITKKGSQRVVRRVQTKEEALKIARDLCKKTGAGLYVHKKDGKFQKI